MTRRGWKGWRAIAVIGVLLLLAGLVKVLGPETYVDERKCGPAISVMLRGPVITDGSTPPAEWIEQCNQDARETVLPWLAVLAGGVVVLAAGLRLRPITD